MAYQNRGVFGHDYGSTLWPTSTWYPAYVDEDGILHVTTTPTSTIGGIASTVDTDIKTLGGSLVPAGPLPVDVMNTATITGTVTTSPTGTQDTDLKTIGGSLLPAGNLPVDASQIGTWDFNLLSPSTLDVDIKTLGGSVVPAGPLPITGTVTTGAGATQDVDIKTVGGEVVPYTNSDDVSTSTYVVPTMGLNYGYDGTNWDRIRTTEAVSGGTITTGLLATDHVVRRSSTVFLDNLLFQGTLTATCSPDWNVTDFNKLGLLITLASSGAPTDIRLTAEFKDWTGTYYVYQNDFWGDLRWDDTAIGASTIHECVMGDLPTGTLRICATTQGSSTINQFSLTVKGQAYTW